MEQQFIKIESSQFAQLMTEFENEIKQMEVLLEEVDVKTKNTQSIWDGDDSEKVMIPFSNLKKEFTDINAQNKKYLDFLQDVIDRYKKYDTDTSNNIDEAENQFDFVGKIV